MLPSLCGVVSQPSIIIHYSLISLDEKSGKSTSVLSKLPGIPRTVLGIRRHNTGEATSYSFNSFPISSQKPSPTNPLTMVISTFQGTFPHLPVVYLSGSALSRSFCLHPQAAGANLFIVLPLGSYLEYAASRVKG